MVVEEWVSVGLLAEVGAGRPDSPPVAVVDIVNRCSNMRTNSKATPQFTINRYVHGIELNCVKLSSLGKFASLISDVQQGS